MIVRSTLQIADTDRVIRATNWESRRLLLAHEGTGFSLHETILFPGTTTEMWYANHIEAVYCIGGSGELLDKETGDRHEIVPGTMYVLDKNQKHELTCHTELRVLCVFNPPLVGPETHDADGTYPLLASAAERFS